MGVRDFFKDIPRSLNGKNYGDLAERSPSQAIKYVIGIVVLSFFLMCIFGIPQVLSFGEYVDEQLHKIDKIQIDGRIIMNDPILIPEEDPIIAIDATNNTVKAEAKRMLVTSEYFYWRTYSGEVKKVKMADWFRNPESRKAIASFIFLIVLLALPGFLFWFMVALVIKYLLIITLFSGIIFISLDLTKYKIPLKKLFCICAYAATIPIIIEVIMLPFGTDYLLPLFSVVGIQFYLITFILYATMVILALVFAEREGIDPPKTKEEKKPEKTYEKTEDDLPYKKRYDEEEIVDVDEQGNRKKKKLDEETGWEGPVERF